MCIFVYIFFRVFFIIFKFIQFISENKNDFLNNNSFINNYNNQLNTNYFNHNSSFQNYNNINNQNNFNLNQENLNLKNELNLKNQIISQQNLKIKNLQNQLNNINNIHNNYQLNIQNLQNIINKNKQELILLRNELKNKNEELNKLKLNNNKTIYSNNNGNKFPINFVSVSHDILYPIDCKNNDTIVKLEEEVYNEYPKYKEYNTYLTCNGNILKRFKTIEENGIKKGNAIIVNIYE